MAPSQVRHSLVNCNLTLCMSIKRRLHIKDLVHLFYNLLILSLDDFDICILLDMICEHVSLDIHIFIDHFTWEA